MPVSPEWVDKFRESIMELDQSVTDFINSAPSIEDACAALVAMNLIKSDFGFVYENMTSAVSLSMKDQTEVSLGDGSTVEKKWSSDRKGWQHKHLVSVVAQRLVESSIDMDTGEILLSQEEIVSKVLDFLQPSYWRVKELQKIGINADMYCEVGETKTSIIVRKAK